MLIACFCSGHWRLDPIVYFDRNDIYWQLWPKSERVADCLVGNIVDKNIVQKLRKAKTLIIKRLQSTRGKKLLYQQHIKGSLNFPFHQISLNLKHVLLDDIYIKQEEVLQAEREIWCWHLGTLYCNQLNYLAPSSSTRGFSKICTKMQFSLSETNGRSISGKCEMYSKVLHLLETFWKK